MVLPDNGVNLGTAYSGIEISTKGVDAQIRHAQNMFQNALNEIGGSLDRLGSQMSSVGSSLSLLTAPLTAFGATGIKTAADFESAMTEISARTGIVGEELQAIGDFAKEMGAATVFSSQDAADAMLQMLTAGVSAGDAMELLPSVMEAAAASGESLGQSADMVTNIMAQFGLEASEAAGVVDTLARTAGASPAQIGQLGQSFTVVGGLARQFGLSVEDTSAVLGVFAQNGIRGAEAGTQLKSVLLNMNRQTDDVTEAWEQLGVSLYDSAGNMRDFETIIQEMDTAMDQLPIEEQNRLMQTLGGSYGIAGISALRGSISIGDMRDSMAGAASASDVAAAQMDTFRQKVNSLMGSLQTLQIEIFQPLIEGSLKNLVSRAIEVVNAMSEWVRANPELTQQLVRVGALIAGIGPVLFVMGQAISAVGGIIAGMAPAIALLTSPIGLLVAAVAGLYIAWRNNFLGMRDMLHPFVDTVSAIFGLVIAQIDEFIMQFRLGLSVGLDGITAFRTALQVAFGDGAAQAFDSLITTVTRVRDALLPMFQEIVQFINNLFGGVNLGEIIQLGLTILSLTNPLGIVMTALRAFGADFIAAFEYMAGAIEATFSILNDGGSVFDALIDGFGEFIDNILINLGVPEDFARMIQRGFFDFIFLLRDQVVPAIAGFVTWFTTTAMPGIVSFLETSVIPSLTAFGDWFTTDALPAVVSFLQTTVIPAIAGFVNLLGSIWAFVQPNLETLANWFMSDGLPFIIQFIETTVIPAIQSFVGFLQGLWETVSPALNSLAEWFTNTGLPTILAFLSDTVAPAIQGFIDLLVGIWNDVSPFLLQLLDWFLYTGLPLVISFIETVVVPVIQGFIDILASIWEVVSPVLQQLYDWFITTALPAVMAFIEGPVTNAIQGFINLLQGIWAVVQPGLELFKNGIKGIFDFVVNNIVQPVIDKIDGIKNAVNDAFNTVARLTGLDVGTKTQYAGRRAAGGHVMKGLPYLVGERGPEPFIPDQSGTILPNSALGGSTNYTVNVTVPIEYLQTSPQAERHGHDLAETIMRDLEAQG